MQAAVEGRKAELNKGQMVSAIRVIPKKEQENATADVDALVEQKVQEALAKANLLAAQKVEAAPTEKPAPVAKKTQPAAKKAGRPRKAPVKKA